MRAIFIGLLLLSAAVNAQPGPADTLKAFHAAASRADLDGYLALMTEEVVFLGTDATERWQGQAFRDFVRDNFESGRGWTYHQVETYIDLSPEGKSAWFDELLQHERLGTCRGSGVMVYGDGGWRVARYNLSVPIPNELVLQVAESIRENSGEVALPTTPSAAEASEPGQEIAAEAEEEKRCRKRHKTNRKASC